MIDRRRLKCVSCGTITMTRTGIGHGTVQKHKFSCPTCGVEIGFVLHLDQQNAGLEYEDPSNAEWVGGDEETPTMALFYPELVVPKELPYPMSPFAATCWNLKDIKEYQGIEAGRRHIKDEVWPVLQRLYIHFENGNLDLMKKDAATIVKEVPELWKGEEWADWLMSVTRHYFDFFVADPTAARPAGRSAALAVIKYEKTYPCNGLRHVRTDGGVVEGTEVRPTPIHVPLRKPFAILNGSARLA